MRNIKVLWGVNAVLLIVVVILSFVLFAGFFTETNVDMDPDHSEQNESTRTIATIGEKTITSADLEKQLLQKYGRELLNQMVDHEVVRMEGKALGITVEESEIQKELKRMQQGYDSEDQFYQAMREQLGMTMDALKTDVYDKLLLEKLATRHVTVTDTQVDEYIAAHPDEFRITQQLRLQQIVVGGPEQAAKVMADIDRGLDFAQVAQERSLDDATRNSGGDLGWIDEDDPFIAEPLLSAVKQLQIGDISEAIAINDHFYILKLVDRKQHPTMTREQIRESVRKEMALREAPPLKEVLKMLREKWNVSILM
ncbi:SurA N-terminal domain-containing protein [Paenibacillus xerothermodurans]|uniref:peptidylprolyl isomerase n=1 Tax=Paenibacillus xerothermodurans TaxID=1977292 RepID=A0A2W1NWM1_PAEXE|nr:SurA N-terminal domain-containing protein [Paenibacillus xerothermodurans]PZE19228.1 peptidylprolyl isomerase [Paenibacillus xerothermodurans]